MAEVAEALADKHGIEDARNRAAHFVCLLHREGYLDLVVPDTSPVDPR